MVPLIHVSILASGSKGNAAVVEGPKGSVLLDCGISRKALRERAREVGCNLDNIKAILLTHEHSDHVKGMRVVCNHFTGPVYATPGTASGSRSLADIPFTLVDHDATLSLAGMTVRCFPTSHDVNDPMCFRFSCGEGDASDAVGWLTDTGYLTDQALDLLYGCRVLCIESNHDEDMLREGPYPRYLKERIHSEQGHLSNTQAAQALRALVTPDTETVVGLHLSEKNNRPSVAVRTLAEAVGAEQANSTFTEARTPDGLLTVCVAAQDRPMSVY